ncbi:hypothetical protein [Mastigocladopsis repens]|uniref:hypothetical protein n=1 Tax=Mastigocladopsis repens TaxID=221287 RepID=UPI0002E203B0|nr:hypothetical protein [Mastigocladopsis repens]
MLRSHIAWLMPVALAFGGFGLNVQSASAQTTYDTYEFTANYNTLVEINPFNEDLGIIRATITGESTDSAPYGLDSFISNTYGQVQPSDNPSITKYNFNSDPGVFGLTDQPILSDIYYGDGPNQLFGTANDSAEINFTEGTIKGAGTITITDGTGIFENATGTITFTEEDALSSDGGPSVGLAILNFSIKTPRAVPEPTATTALVGIGVTGAVLLRKHRRKTNFN